MDGIEAGGGATRSNVTSAPAVILSRSVDISSREEFLELAWRRDGYWHTHMAAREAVMNNRQLTALSAHGFPVTSENARMVVLYLNDYEAANLAVMPTSRISHRFGWQGEDDGVSFLVGERLVTARPDTGGLQFRSSSRETTSSHAPLAAPVLSRLAGGG